MPRGRNNVYAKMEKRDGEIGALNEVFVATTSRLSELQKLHARGRLSGVTESRIEKRTEEVRVFFEKSAGGSRQAREPVSRDSRSTLPITPAQTKILASIRSALAFSRARPSATGAQPPGDLLGTARRLSSSARSICGSRSGGTCEAATPMNNLAWILSTCADASLRDGKRAVELATHACELTGRKNAWLLDTLAAAFAETGDFKAAVETQREAMALLPTGAEI